MEHMQHKQITDRYKHTSGLVLGTREVMGRLISALILNMEQAKSAHAQKRYDTMAEFNRKSLRILGAIRRSLENHKIDPKELAGLQLMHYLRLLYRDIFIRLANVVQTTNPQEEFDRFLAHLRQQYQAWSGSGKKAQEALPAPTDRQGIALSQPRVEKPKKPLPDLYA